MVMTKKIPSDNHVRITDTLRLRLELYLESRFGVDWKRQQVISSTYNEALNKFLESEGF